MIKPQLLSAVFLMTLSLCLVAGCSSDTVPENAPEGHTTMKDGVPHAPGLNNPTVNCTACHGDTLTGGNDEEPSCFSCHGQEW